MIVRGAVLRELGDLNEGFDRFAAGTGVRQVVLL
jgi:Zn-dependent alcohol dehydrogenase